VRGALRVVPAPEGRPPFPIDGRAYEEDTFLVLSAEAVVRIPKEPLMRVMTRVLETRPRLPGSVAVRGTHPLRLLAIVHDLNQEPSWKEEWVACALEGIFREAESRRLRSIAIPFLGTLHGSLEKETFLGLLKGALEKISPVHLKQLWLVIPQGTSPDLLKRIEFD
jgi:hypothetical protein